MTPWLTNRRRVIIACISFWMLVGVLLVSCGGNGASPAVSLPSSATPAPLSSADVQLVVQIAASSANAPLVIAVADRAGKILAVFRNASAPATSTGNFGASVDS